MVDVGGGRDPVSIGLAERFPGVMFTVQNLAHVIEEGPARVPAELKGRMGFAVGDVLQEQTIKDADVYLFRHVQHKFPDNPCVEVLRNQVHVRIFMGPIRSWLIVSSFERRCLYCRV